MKLQFCFCAHCKRGVNVREHTHEVLELVYYVEGSGRATLGDTTYDARRNSFMIIPAGMVHDQENLTPLVSLCVGLSQSGLEKFQGSWTDAGGVLADILRKLMREMETRRTGHDLICRGLIYQIAGAVHRIAVENATPPRKQALVNKAIEIIGNREGAVSVGELAEQLYVSKDYLRHLFCDFTDQSPIQHIIRARINKARDLLSRRDLDIKQVAEQSGFESAYYFSRLFRKVTGTSPSAYRNMLGLHRS